MALARSVSRAAAVILSDTRLHPAVQFCGLALRATRRCEGQEEPRGRMRFMDLASSCRGGLWSNPCSSLVFFPPLFFFFLLRCGSTLGLRWEQEGCGGTEKQKRSLSLQKANHVRLHIDDSIKACADYFSFSTQQSLNTLNLAMPRMLRKGWEFFLFFPRWKN